jgi:hypothetical protein
LLRIATKDQTPDAAAAVRPKNDELRTPLARLSHDQVSGATGEALKHQRLRLHAVSSRHLKSATDYPSAVFPERIDQVLNIRPGLRTNERVVFIDDVQQQQPRLLALRQHDCFA